MPNMYLYLYTYTVYRNITLVNVGDDIDIGYRGIPPVYLLGYEVHTRRGNFFSMSKFGELNSSVVFDMWVGPENACVSFCESVEPI